MKAMAVVIATAMSAARTGDNSTWVRPKGAVRKIDILMATGMTRIAAI